MSAKAGGNPTRSPHADGARASRTTRSPATVIGACLLVAAAIALWFIFRASDAPRPPAPTALVTRPEVDREHATPAPPAVVERASDDIPVMAPGAHDNSNAEPRHPHPITPEHERNFKQLNMIAVLNSAVDLGDFEELRRANRKYREDYPEATLYQDGYDVIAECLESRTPEARAAGERYWATQTASNLRRYVRRYCME